MKKAIITINFLVFASICFAQNEEIYHSKEEDNYYKSRAFKAFKPVDIHAILNLRREGISITTKDSYTPYSDSLYFTPYQDSTLTAMFNSINAIHRDLIGKIDKIKILKHQKKNNIEAFVYESHEFEEEIGEAGIWIGFSKDFGTTYSYYYTGLVQRQPVLLKWYSNEDLIVNENKLQIEGVFLRQTEPFAHPGPSPEYQCLKDGLSIVFDLTLLRQDSDSDGLTDLIEKKLGTDPNNNDTDSDAVTDDLDLNPRKHGRITKRSMLYEAILNEPIEWDSLVPVITNKDNKVDQFATDSTETILIVTEDKV